MAVANKQNWEEWDMEEELITGYEFRIFNDDFPGYFTQEDSDGELGEELVGGYDSKEMAKDLFANHVVKITGYERDLTDEIEDKKNREAKFAHVRLMLGLREMLEKVRGLSHEWMGCEGEGCELCEGGMRCELCEEDEWYGM